MIHTVTVGEQVDGVPTVVFLHGLFGQGRNFLTIAKGLQPEMRGLLVDLPNHGRSSWTETVDLAAMADEVADTVRTEAGGPVHVVGHSLGGKVAMLLALRHPDLVERLVVVDIAPVPSTDVSQFEQLLGALATLDLASLSSRGDADEQLQELIGDTTVRAFLLQNLHRTEQGWAWRANLTLLRSSLDVIGSFPQTGEAVFENPVLWVVGERSTYTREEDAEAMRVLFPRLQRVSVKGAGHWVHSEQPAAFLATVRAFLAASLRR
ncbi:alpha/beta fold hydrolase [Pseudactinotalea suaedae]|uniref:alpha/beta fold hydrolase n=1 Tax=Pseudactinotalea suaedae TaxID=1524924 RepID=UPI0012E18349|nr:alpha/beta fold hydrolase [Pseudactinotalea suaedae]